jgi:NAD(P)-dependent dehydrogenase (short-subunit alcohol dehydrogenase family)
MATFGRIDLLVNNAGNNINKPLLDSTTDDFAVSLNVHLMAAFWTMREALPSMRAQDYGRIVNTASALGSFAGINSAPFIAAKAALIGVSKAAALENEDRDIRINTLAPLAMTPLGRDGNHSYLAVKPETLSLANFDKLTVQRVSPAVLFMLLPECPFTGEVIAAGGGRVARIFTATARGYVDEELSSPDLLDHVDDIFAADDFIVPRISADQYPLYPR